MPRVSRPILFGSKSSFENIAKHCGCEASSYHFLFRNIIYVKNNCTQLSTLTKCEISLLVVQPGKQNFGPIA